MLFQYARNTSLGPTQKMEMEVKMEISVYSQCIMSRRCALLHRKFGESSKSKRDILGSLSGACLLTVVLFCPSSLSKQEMLDLERRSFKSTPAI